MVRAEDGQTGVVTGHRPRPRLVATAQPEQRGGHGQIDGARLRALLHGGQTAVQPLSALRLGERLLVPVLTAETAGQIEPQDEGEPLRQVGAASASRASASASGWRPSAMRAKTCPLRAAVATCAASGSVRRAAAGTTAAHSASHSACRPSEVSTWARSDRAFSVCGCPSPKTLANIGSAWS